MIQIEFACSLMHTIALGCIKLSILFFYRRIFCTTKSGIFHYITIFGVSVVSAWSIGFFFALLLICGSSIEAQWGSLMTLSAKCSSSPALKLGVAISDFIIDCVIMVMPIPMVR